MKKTILFAFLIISWFANSQSNYQRKLFPAVSTGSVSDAVYTNEYNTTTLLLENVFGPTQFSGFATLTKFTTTTGNVTSSKSFSIAGYDLAIKNVVKNNQMLYMVASLTNSAGVTGCIIKYNLSTNTTVWRRNLAINQSPYTLNTMVYDNDKYLYALGSCNHFAFSSDLFVSKIDTNGTLIWIKEMGENSLQHTPSTILYNGKRELYVTSTGTLNTSSHAIILRLDSSGAILNSNVLYTSASTGFREKYSSILRGKFTTIDKTMNNANGDPGPFLVRALDSTLNVVATKTIDGLNIKQIYSNNTNLLITGAAPVNLGFQGFRTIRLDTLLNIFGSRYFKKISTSSNNTSAACFINSTNNSFHFFKPNGNDTVTVIRADIYEGVGCRDSAFVTTSLTLSYSVMPYTFTTAVIAGTLTTISLPVGTLTYSSTSLCTALTTGFSSFSENGFISVYPNPANEILNFKFEMINANLQIKIFNGLGQLVEEEEIIIENNSGSISTNDLQTGIYFISLYDSKNQLMGVKKFVKEN